MALKRSERVAGCDERDASSPQPDRGRVRAPGLGGGTGSSLLGHDRERCRLRQVHAHHDSASRYGFSREPKGGRQRTGRVGLSPRFSLRSRTVGMPDGFWVAPTCARFAVHEKPAGPIGGGLGLQSPGAGPARVPGRIHTGFRLNERPHARARERDRCRIFTSRRCSNSDRMTRNTAASRATSSKPSRSMAGRS